MRHEQDQHGQTRDGGPRQHQRWAWVLSSMGARVLGLLTVSVLLAAEDAHSETYGETLGAIVLALVLYWLTHSYANSASWRVEHGERLTLRELARDMLHEVQLFVGAALPLVPLLICWTAGVSLTIGIRAALWTDAALIVAVEVVAGVRAHLTRRELVFQSLFGAALGLLVLALRLVLHH